MTLFAPLLALAATLVPVAPTVIAPAVAGATSISIASNGIVSLVVWSGGNGYVYGTRFDASGRLLDATPVLLDISRSSPPTVTVVATDGGFLAAWGGVVRFVGLDGTLGQPHSYGVADSTIAVSGDRALLVGSGLTFGPASALLLDSHGNLVRQALIPLPAPGHVFADPNGFVFLPDGNDRELFAQRISRDGSPSAPRLIATGAINAVGVFDGTNDIVVWNESDGIHSATLDPVTLTPHLHGVIAPGIEASIASDGTSTWLEVTSNYELSAIPLQDGVPSGAPIDIGRGFHPAITLLSGAPAAAWIDQQAYVLQIGAHRPPLLLSQSGTLRSNPRVANNGTTRVAVWQETSGPQTLGDVPPAWVAAGGLAADNTPLPASGTILSHRDQLAGAPAIAAGDGDFLVVWYESKTLLGRRITSDLLFEDFEPFPIDSGVNALPAPRIAFDGRQWCVLYAGGEANGGISLRAKRITAAGAVVDAQPIVLEPAPAFATKVVDFDVTWNGTNFVAVWQWQSWLGAHAPVYSAMRVGVVSPFDTSVRQIEDPSRYGPRIAAGPHSMLIAARRPNDGFVIGTFLPHDLGTLLIGMPRLRHRAVTQPEREVILEASPQYAFSLPWNGSRYELIYQPVQSYNFEGSGLPILRTTVDESGGDVQTGTIAIPPVDALMADAADESTIVVFHATALDLGLDWLIP